MRVLLVVLLFVITACGSNRTLFPKKYFGEYQGRQEAYEVQVEGASMMVEAANYTLNLSENQLLLKTSRHVAVGEYRLTADTKMYYALHVVFENGTEEEWQLWKKKKQVIRKAPAPQPSIIFVKP